MEAGKVPLLITLDVHDHKDLVSVVVDSAEFLTESKLSVTYFVPALLVRKFLGLSQALRRARALGHSVGCHGYCHSVEEDFLTMPNKRELALLSEATRILEDALGEAIVSFRAPGWRLGPRTLHFLSCLGYKADSSVTSQRFVPFSVSPWVFGPLWAPRSPYHPSEQSPYRRGQLEILEIPTSCFLLALGHGVIGSLPGPALFALLRSLLFEAHFSNRVIVPMLHPESLLGRDEYAGFPKLSWKEFFPSSYGGVTCRYRFLERDPTKLQGRVGKFLAMLRNAPGLIPMSIDGFLDWWRESATGQPRFCGVRTNGQL